MTAKKRGPKKRADSKVSTSIRVSPDTLARLRASGNVSATVERLVRGTAPTITERPTCATCVHWRHHGSDQGTCTRYPPRVPDDYTMQSDASGMLWPLTYGDSTCGEHAYLASRVDSPQPPTEGSA